MAYSIHTQIMDALVTVLEGITTGGGYSFSTRAVFQFEPNESTIKNESITPALFIWAPTETKADSEFIGAIYNEMELHVAFLDRPGTDTQRKGAEMGADIQKALLSNNPRIIGGATVELKPVLMELLVNEVDEGQAGGHLQLLAQYTTQYNDPYTAY